MLKLDPQNEQAKIALHWVREPGEPKPSLFAAPESQIRPTRPPVVGSVLEITPAENFSTSAPYDTWILRTANKKEYGPIPKQTLDVWVREGRASLGMKLLRADWSKWKRIEKIYPELDPAEDVVDEFPKLDVTGQPVAPDEPVEQGFESLMPDILNRPEEPITDLPNIVDQGPHDE